MEPPLRAAHYPRLFSCVHAPPRVWRGRRPINLPGRNRAGVRMCIRDRGGGAGARGGVAGPDVVCGTAHRRGACVCEDPGGSAACGRGGILVGGVRRPRPDGGCASGRAGGKGPRDCRHRTGPARRRFAQGPVRSRRRGRRRRPARGGGTDQALLVRCAHGARAGVGLASDRAAAAAPADGAIRAAPTTKAGCSRTGSSPRATSSPRGASALRPRCRWPGCTRCAPASPGRFVPRSTAMAARG